MRRGMIRRRGVMVIEWGVLSDLSKQATVVGMGLVLASHQVLWNEIAGTYCAFALALALVFRQGVLEARDGMNKCTERYDEGTRMEQNPLHELVRPCCFKACVDVASKQVDR